MPGSHEIIQRIQQISNTLPAGIKQPFILQVRSLEYPGLPGHGLGRRPRRKAALRPRLQYHRAPDRAHHRRRLGRRRRRQDPPDHRQPGPRPPLREGHLRPGRRAVGQRLELPHAVRRRQDRHRRLQLFTNNQFQLVEADGGHRRPPKVGDIPVRVRDLGHVADSHEAQSSRRPRQRRARRVPAREQAAGARTPSRWWTPSRPSCRSSSACRPGVSVGLTFDQSTYIRQSINEPLARGPPGRAPGLPRHPALPPELRLDRHHLRRDPALDPAHAHRDVLPRARR